MPQAVPIITAVAAAASAGAAIYSATRGGPKPVKPPQAAAVPNLLDLKAKNRNAFATYGDTAARGTLLDPASSSGNTLLGK